MIAPFVPIRAMLLIGVPHISRYPINKPRAHEVVLWLRQQMNTFARGSS
jgi:hypothetical protein